jgi:predicted glycoside hydrolase/deacetylase ChbG (UPF0249 family)
MKKKLIIVADDFGFSEAYNYGVIKAYKEGVVTTMSLMSNMAAAPHAVQLWRSECPEAPLVQHTNFVQYRPVSAPQTVPSLVDENGMFYRSYCWRSDRANDPKCKGDIYPTYEDLYTETLAQLERHKELVGHYPNHFEGHSAMTKPMRQAFADLGEKMHIHNMATSLQERPGIRAACELLMQGGNAASAMDVLNHGSRPENFEQDDFGILASPYEINVLHFHPGYLDQYLLDNTSLTLPRCRDLQTLCDPRVRTWLQEHEIELVNFDEVYR